MSEGHFKDEILDRLARTTNVAQFISFGRGLDQRFAWVRGRNPNESFASIEDAVRTLLLNSPERSVNVRTFEPDNPKSRDFAYGLLAVDEVIAKLHHFSDSGLNTIVNETIDVGDGGVSGVAYGNLVEFAPGDTPRCVEKPGTAALPRDIATRLVQIVYGITPELPTSPTERIEFSVHPLRRGYRHGHTIIWEVEETSVAPNAPEIQWPNRFSRFIGDKAFGLLIGSLLGCDVPHTTVIPRRLAPFSFGQGGTAEPWIRTCPTEQVPGKFTTQRGWTDPFALMAAEDPTGDAIASVLFQRGVDARASGAAASQADGTLAIEGVSGFGDEFMIGQRPPEELPQSVLVRVREAYAYTSRHLGPVRFEWVDDGERCWIVQLHRGASVSSGRTIVPGDAPSFRAFNIAQGLERLRTVIDEVKETKEGIVLVGRIGVTSHFGDVLRRAGVPSRLEDPPA